MMSIFQNKLAIALGIALAAFVIATIVVAVEKSNLQDDLDDCQKKLNDKTTTTSTTTTPTTTTTEKPETPPPEELSYRLPRAIVPVDYDLHLHPDLKTQKFTGTVKIGLDIKEPTDKIILHSNALSIGEIKVQTTKGDVPVKSKDFDAVKEFLIIQLKENVIPGQKYILSVDFNGNMTKKIVGLYSSKYVNEDNKDRWMATSKFEPTYARQAFPCFDEPEMKAKFKVTLVRPKETGYIALSNMDQVDEKGLDETRVEVSFAESVPMSTYLACFIVCDFDHQKKIIDTKNIGDPFTMRVFATPAQKSKVKFALDTGAKIVEHYIQYFQIAYPLPKLDMAAIPDFVSGAMEHWGLVTFRETGLLYDETISSSSNKQRIGSVIAHELAHMWFGNLVTMKWWNDLWLNEGFATHMQYKGLDVAEPSWKMIDQFLVDGLHGVLKLDGTLASHPIVQTAESPDQITELFDSITYQKGASVIRMLEHFVGEDKFQKAVTQYLNKFQYKNAVTDDLLTEIETLMPKTNIKQMMETWTQQMGLPVVQISVLPESEGKVRYKLTQKRFFANPEDENKERSDSPFNYKWHIPITYQYVLPDNTNVEKKSLLFKFNDTEVGHELSTIKTIWHVLGFHCRKHRSNTKYCHQRSCEVDWKGVREEIETLMPKTNIKQMMETWTQQMGLPVVQISVLPESEGKVRYKLTQKRFFANPEDENKERSDSPFNYKWHIPITYQYVLPDNTNVEKKSLLFKFNDTEASILIPSNAKWLKFNVDQVGYYRVNYPEDLWKTIIGQLTSSPVTDWRYSVADRAHLLNDAFSLADAEQLSYDIALDLTKYLKNETDYVPWNVAASKINSLRHILYYTNTYEQFVKYGRTLIQSAYELVGWEVANPKEDGHLKNLLRATILNAACALELPECITEATTRFEKWISNTSMVPNPDIRDIVYNYGMAHAGNDEIWTIVWSRFKSETDASEKLKLMTALSTIKESWILQKYIDLAWDEKNVRSQDYFTCIQSIAVNRIGEGIVWDYVRENWDKLVGRFGLNERYLGRLIPSITNQFSANVKLMEMRSFFLQYPEAGAGAAARDQALANVENNIKWLESNKNKVSEWLKKQKR